MFARKYLFGTNFRVFVSRKIRIYQMLAFSEYFKSAHLNVPDKRIFEPPHTTGQSSSISQKFQMSKKFDRFFLRNTYFNKVTPFFS